MRVGSKNGTPLPRSKDGLLGGLEGLGVSFMQAPPRVILRRRVHRVQRIRGNELLPLFSFTLTVLSASGILESTVRMSTQEFVMSLQLDHALGVWEPN